MSVFLKDKYKIFDEKFYTNFYGIKNARNHYLTIGKGENYLTSEKEFLLLYPKFPQDILVNSSNICDKYRAMYKYHQNQSNNINMNMNLNININTEKKIENVKNMNNIALCIHIGNLQIFLEDIHFYRFLCKNNNLDVYITLIVEEEEKYAIDNLTQLLNIKNVTLEIIENRGLDIGGFFKSLVNIRKSGKKYDYIIKTHTKGVKEWRKNLLSPFLNLGETIKFLNRNENIGILGHNKWLYSLFSPYLAEKTISQNTNYYHLEKLCNKFNINLNTITKLSFIAGTIFIIRTNLLDKIFLDETFSDQIYKELNDENSLDINWYASKYVHPNLNLGLDQREKIEKHYRENKGSYSPNLVHKLKNSNTLSKIFRDGMIEHAWERFFSILAHSQNYITYGYNPENLIKKHDIKFIPIIFPQFHEIPENNKFWGKGFTEWTLLKNIQDENIWQPNNDIGYYDLTSLKHRQKISYLSDKYFIDGFCFYHYWFGYQVMYKPAELMLLEGHPNKPFFFNWANETWTKKWDGIETTQESILLQQEYLAEEEHFMYLLPFFKSHRYMKIDGKPIFSIYRLEGRMFFILDLWNKLALKNNLPGIFFVGTLGHFMDSNNLSKELYEHNDIQAISLFQPGYISSLYHDEIIQNCTENSIFYNKESDREIYTEEIYLEKNPDVKKMIQQGLYKNGKEHYDKTGPIEKIFRNFNKITYSLPKIYDLDIKNFKNLSHALNIEKKNGYIFRGSVTNWNNTPRKKNPSIFLGSHPEKFTYHLIDLVYQINENPNPNNNLILINAWNEWNEGAVLEPTKQYGYAYLEALKFVKEFFNTN